MTHPTANPIITAAPSTLRKGLSPRMISRAAHTTRLTVPTTDTIMPSVPAGWNNSRVAVAARKTHSGMFGIWTTTSLPVSGLRKNLEMPE